MQSSCAAALAASWLRTATVEPARYLGRPDAGVLKAENAADIVLLDRNPLKALSALKQVSGVVLHGVPYSPTPPPSRSQSRKTR